MIGAEIFISGRVQGVGFRKFTMDCANHTQLYGIVRNCPDGRVNLEVEGPKGEIESFISTLKKGPPASRVDSVEVIWGKNSNRFNNFSITY